MMISVWPCAIQRVVWKEYIVSLSRGPLTETQSYIIDSCLARMDLGKAEQLVRDWDVAAGRNEKRHVSRWVPGTHYYALEKKFGTLGEAIAHLVESGYRYAGTRTRWEYRESGG